MKYNSTASYAHIYNETGKLPFTYLIGWSKQNRFYYGVRYGKGCHPVDLWNSYFTSSKTVCQFRKDHGEPDIIEIRQVFNTPEEARYWEDKVLYKLKVVRNDKWLNRGRCGKEFYFEKHTPESRKKMSESGKVKVFTQEHKDNISKSTKGITKSEEARKNMSVAQKGKIVSEEARKKLSESKKGHKGTTNGTRIWNDGERNYFLSADEKPEPHWKRKMLRKKHNDNKPGGNNHNKGKVYYNDGIKNYFIPYEQEPEKNWTAGMLPKKSRPGKVKS